MSGSVIAATRTMSEIRVQPVMWRVWQNRSERPQAVVKPRGRNPEPQPFLRRRAGSAWGLQPKTVQTFVGHATLQMNMDTYGHMFPSEDHSKAMDAIARGPFV